jgi:hypothetical protein
LGCWLWGWALSAQAQVKADVSLGFNGRFLPDHLAPVRLTLSNEGLAVRGQLELIQKVENPLQGSFTQELRYAVELESETSKSFEFHIFIHGYIYPLVIRFRSGERIYAEMSIDLREMFVTEKLAIGIGDPPLAKQLPDGQSIESMSIQELPARWVGYDAVQRIYLGRLDTNLLTKPQQDAIRDWVLWGGELVILGGENWRIQRSAWLEQLMPLTVKAIEERSVGEARAIAVIGAPKDESFRIRQEQDGTILALERPYGLGSVIFYNVDPLKTSGVVWPDQLRRSGDWQLSENLTKTLGKNALKRVMLQYPDRGFITLMLAGLILLFSLFSLALMRGTAGGSFLTAIVFLFMGASAFLVLFVNQPVYSSTMHGLELSVERIFSDVDFALEQTWYSLFTERGDHFQMEVDSDFLRQVPNEALQHANDLTLEHRGESLKAQFYILAQRQQHFVFERVKPAKLKFAVDRRVRPYEASVYNGERLALGPGIIVIDGQSYPMGEIAAGESKTFSLVTVLEKGVTGMIQSEHNQNLAKVKESLFETAKSSTLSEPISRATWLTWGPSAMVSPLSGEDRLALKLFIVSEETHVAK